MADVSDDQSAVGSSGRPTGGWAGLWRKSMGTVRRAGVASLPAYRSGMGAGDVKPASRRRSLGKAPRPLLAFWRVGTDWRRDCTGHGASTTQWKKHQEQFLKIVNEVLRSKSQRAGHPSPHNAKALCCFCLMAFPSRSERSPTFFWAGLLL